MDFAYDLMEKLREQGIDFCLITLRKGGYSLDKVDLFYEVTDDQAEKTMLFAMQSTVDQVTSGEIDTAGENFGEVIDYGEVPPEIVDFVLEKRQEEALRSPKKKPKKAPKKAAKKTPSKRSSKKAPKKASKKAPKKAVKKPAKKRPKKDDNEG